MTEHHTDKYMWPDFDYVNGKKMFNDNFDATVLHEEISTIDNPTDLSIVVPTMERPSKTLSTIRSLAISAILAHLPTEIVIMDNSFEPGLYEKLKKELTVDKVFGSVALRYYYDRTLTFPVARNLGIDIANKSSKYFASWDSDIYCSPDALSVLFDYWSDNPNIGACAPPLATYNSRVTPMPTFKSELIGDIIKNPEDRAKLDMPGKLGDEIGQRQGEAILSTMLRGAYLFRRSFAEHIRTIHPEEDLFLRDFVVWSNVPTCMTANEIGESMAYVIDNYAIAFHDLSQDGVSMSKDIPSRIEENLKSLSLLFYRNIEQVANYPDNLLSKFNKEAIIRLLNVDGNTAECIVEYLIGVAELIKRSKSYKDLTEPNDLSNLLPDSQKQNPHLCNFINRLAVPSVYERTKGLKSYDTSVNPYELQ